MDEKLKYKIRSAVEKLGLPQSRQMFGDNLIQQAYINNPLLFLNQFNIKMGLNKLDFADDRADACVYALTFLQEQFLQQEVKVEIW